MAVATETDKLSTKLKVEQFDFDPDATTATEISWVDMRDFMYFMALFFRTVGTSALTYRIIGNDQSDGSGTDVEIKTGSAAPDAVGDYAFLECSMQEVLSAGSAAGVDVRYLTLECTVATGTDEGVVTYIRSGARHATSGLTADSIA